MTLAGAKRVLGRSMAVAGLAAAIAVGMGTGGVNAQKSAGTLDAPPTWYACIRATNTYYEDLWEAANDPEQGVDYDAVLEISKRAMDRACFEHMASTI